MVNQSAVNHHRMRVCNKKIKKEHELSSQNIQICEIQMPHGKELLQHLFSLQLGESIWSIDVNKLELICFKYPLKVNWHCWNRCMCVYGIMDSNVVFLIQIKNVASFEIMKRFLKKWKIHTSESKKSVAKFHNILFKKNACLHLMLQK